MGPMDGLRAYQRCVVARNRCVFFSRPRCRRGPCWRSAVSAPMLVRWRAYSLRIRPYSPAAGCVVAAYSGVFSAGFDVLSACHAPLTPERAGAALAGDHDLARLCRGERALSGEPPLMLPTCTATQDRSSQGCTTVGGPSVLILHQQSWMSGQYSRSLSCLQQYRPLGCPCLRSAVSGLRCSQQYHPLGCQAGTRGPRCAHSSTPAGCPMSHSQSSVCSPVSCLRCLAASGSRHRSFAFLELRPASAVSCNRCSLSRLAVSARWTPVSPRRFSSSSRSVARPTGPRPAIAALAFLDVHHAVAVATATHHSIGARVFRQLDPSRSYALLDLAQT